MQGMINRIPSIANSEIRQFVNGPESFTPDGKFLFGETAEVRFENWFALAEETIGGYNRLCLACYLE